MGPQLDLGFWLLLHYKRHMTDPSDGTRHVRRKRRRRVRSSRKLRFFLLSLGIAGIPIGLGLCVAGVFRDNPGFRALGLAYVAGSCCILLVRAAIIQYDKIRRRRYADQPSILRQPFSGDG